MWTEVAQRGQQSIRDGAAHRQRRAVLRFDEAHAHGRGIEQAERLVVFGDACGVRIACIGEAAVRIPVGAKTSGGTPAKSVQTRASATPASDAPQPNAALPK